VAKFPDLAPRIVFLNGDTLSEETQIFLNNHGTRHLSKPFELAAVERVISEIMAQHFRPFAA